MKDVLKKALQSLSGRGEATSDELKQAQRSVLARIDEVEEEIRQIDDRTPPPPIRRDVLNSGSPEDLQELDARLARLKAESKQLYHRRSELHNHIQDALAREALANVRTLHKELADAVVAAEAAIAAADAAREKAGQAAKRILDARQICQSTGVPHDDLAVDYALAKRAAEAAGVQNGNDQRVLMARELASLSRQPMHLRQQPV